MNLHFNSLPEPEAPGFPPEHVIPLPENPALHVQLWVAGIFLHTAFTSQGFDEHWSAD